MMTEEFSLPLPSSLADTLLCEAVVLQVITPSSLPFSVLTLHYGLLVSQVCVGGASVVTEAGLMSCIWLAADVRAIVGCLRVTRPRVGMVCTRTEAGGQQASVSSGTPHVRVSGTNCECMTPWQLVCDPAYPERA